MTFSLVARCARSGSFGIAISSSSPCVAARCAHARPGVGAVLSQNITDPRLGPAGLDLLQSGLSADAALAALRRHAGDALPYRQLALVDRHGEARAFSGAMALGIHAQCTAPDVAAAGNLLADRHVPEAMAEHFRARPDAALGARLIGALRAGLTAGGEAGPVRSAGLLIVGEAAWPIADLRVDWADDPLGDLEALWRLWEPQMEDYVRRGLDPTAAPSFGVAGDP